MSILFLLLIFLIGLLSCGITESEAVTLGVQGLSEQLRRQTQRSLLLGRFMGEITTVPQQDNMPRLVPSGNIIEVNSGIRTSGIGNSLLIPMDMDLSGEATLGDSSLIGREESSATYFTRVYYKQVRKALVDLEGQEDYDMAEVINIYRQSLPKLQRWHAQYENWMFVTGLYEGVSENLSTSKTDDVNGEGGGISKRYHPNMYTWTGAGSVQTAGVLTRIGTTDKFPTAAQIYTAASGGSTVLSMSSYTLDALGVECQMLDIKKTVASDGFEFWPLFISPQQQKTLLQDTAFRAALATGVWTQIKDNPLIKGAVGYYGGFVVYVDSVAVRGFSGTSGSNLNILGSVALIDTKKVKRNPRFLPQRGNIYYSSATYSNQVAFVLGASAMGKALNRALRFESETKDYNNWRGVAGVTSYGYSRLDWVPEDEIDDLKSTPANVTSIENKSSVLVMTWQQI